MTSVLHMLKCLVYVNSSGCPFEGVSSSNWHRQSLFGQAPLYLADDCRLVSDSTQRSLRSVDVPNCVVPRTLSS